MELWLIHSKEFDYILDRHDQIETDDEDEATSKVKETIEE